MKYCQDCGTKTQPLNTGGGCGGLGCMVRCPNKHCDQVWEQTSGGILPTPGGERWSRVTKFITYQGQLARNVSPHQLYDDDHNVTGQWEFWDELYDKHGPFASKEEAQKAIRVRAQSLNREHCYNCNKISLEEHLCNSCLRCPHCKCFESCPEFEKQPELFGETS